VCEMLSDRVRNTRFLRAYVPDVEARGLSEPRSPRCQLPA
jgi:hypothetical protein